MISSSSQKLRDYERKLLLPRKEEHKSIENEMEIVWSLLLIEKCLTGSFIIGSDQEIAYQKIERITAAEKSSLKI